jgi:N-methylhydantoinase B
VELITRESATLSLFVERRFHPALGVLGGQPGMPSRVAWTGRDEGFVFKGRNQMKGGDRIEARYPGGGGFGDPRERDRDAVREDLEAGLISERVAREVYGL